MFMQRAAPALRSTLASLTCFVLGAAVVHAASFDPKIKAPRAVSAADFTASAGDYLNTYAQKSSTSSPAAVLRDPSAYAKWVDLDWKLNLALEEGRTLGDLAALGLKQGADGSYTVDVREHPQWLPLDLLLQALKIPTAFTAHSEALLRRGFRDEDIAILKNYVDSANWESKAFTQNRVLTESFASRARSRQRAKLRIDSDETISYVYQRSRNSLEARRAWAVGLLDSLDQERQNILISYFEGLHTTRTYLPSQSNLIVQLERTLAPLLSGEYAQALEQEAMRVRQ